MTEKEWLNAMDPEAMLSWLAKSVRPRRRRKLRLIAVGFCRLIWPILEDELCRRAVEVAELFADGLATEEVRAECHWSTSCARDEKWFGEGDPAEFALAHAVNSAVHDRAASA